MKETIKSPVIDFIEKNHWEWARKSGSSIEPYLLWHRAHESLSISEQNGQVDGVCTIRLFVRLEDWMNPWVFHDDGAFCLIDLLVATNPIAMANCFHQLFRRWGPRPVILWERARRTEQPRKPPRMFKWHDFCKLARRISYGIIDLG